MREATTKRSEYQRLHRSQPTSAQSRDRWGAIPTAQHGVMMPKRLVYLCDWLPPDFGAVGQYAVLEARDWARRGFAVTLGGLASRAAAHGPVERVGDGSLEIVQVHRRTYPKHRFVRRLVWTVGANLALLRAAFTRMRTADAVVFTGSPPLMLHFIAPLNLLLGRRL